MTAPVLQFWPVMRRVERAAWNLILKCAKAKKLTTLPLPIPIEQWIEAPLGIQLTIADLSHLGQGVLGAAMVEDREIMVSEALVNQEVRFRFTAAHELGHLTLHSKLATSFRDTEDADYFERRIEREADRFAASFLMPIPALCSEFAAVAASVEQAPQTLLFAVATGDPRAQSKFRQMILPHLTKTFGVSTSAAVRRFSDIQLPSGEPALPFEAGLALLPSEQVKEAIWRK